MRRLLALLLLCAATSRAEPDIGALQGQTIQVCDDANEWPPYTYYARDAAGKRTDRLQGYAVELLERILQPHGLRHRIVLLPWMRCLNEVKRGSEFQMLLNATRNPERERDFLISLPIYSTRTFYFWSQRNHPQGLQIRSQADLKRYRIGGVRGYTYSQLDQIDMASLIRAPNYASLVQMLHYGRLDVILVGEEVFHGLAGLPGYELGRDTQLGRAPLPIRQPNRFHMLISRQHPQGPALHALINQGIETLQRSGELQELLARHLRR